MSDHPTFTRAADADPAPADSSADPAVTSLGWGSPSNISPPLASASRYVLGSEIAHGGMGAVYRATDTTFGREVAVKVLKETFSPTSGVARRFADEARITGQLQHPAIPPVHDFGTLPDGRPFLAMKLIKGQTLDDLLKERADLNADRGRFIIVFEQICQAIAYAHAHNVIHRDLKPANVMVGSYGEVQVMDWGLAKVLGTQTDEEDPDTTANVTNVDSLRDSDGLFTQAGSVLGTPAFMSPEQALGAVTQIDARSDVFGLGAVLAVILTGKPPFTSASAETSRIQAAQGKVGESFARLDECGADAELVELCKRCLSPEPTDRPKDAGEVARAVADLRAAADERIRQAELDRVKAEGEKVAAELKAAELRKRRRVQLALAGAVGLILLGIGVVGWYSERQAAERATERERMERMEREREAAELRQQLEDERRAAAERDRLRRNAEAVATLLHQSEEALRAGDAAKAAVTLEAAQKRSAEGGAEALALRSEQLRADLTVLTDLDTVDRFRWTPLESKLPDAASVATRYREALGRFGADPDSVPVDQAAARISASLVRDRLVTALDRMLRAQKTAGVRAALHAVDPDPYRDAVRDAVLAQISPQTAELLSQPEALHQPPGFVAFMSESGAIGVERKRELLRAAVQRRPGELGLLMALGNTYQISSRDAADERVRWFQAAVAVAPANPAPHISLGVSLGAKGDRNGAEAAFREAIQLDPMYTFAHNNLGVALQSKGDLDGAIAELQEAIRLDPKYAQAHSNLGTALQAKGDLDGAIAKHQEAIRLEPKNAMAHTNLGAALQAKGDSDAAIAEYRLTLRLDPKNLNAHNNLGVSLRAKGDLDGAIEAFRETLQLDPKSVNTHNNLGDTLQQKGDLDGAIVAYREALRLNPKYLKAQTSLLHVERMRELLQRLPDLLAGRGELKTPAEGCEFARFCVQPFQRRYVAAMRFYERAFASDPALAADLKTGHRYDAACYAARAARGDGVDAPIKPDERKVLRGKALAWLQEDMSRYRKWAGSSSSAERKFVVAKLTHWLRDSDLSWVRNPVLLATSTADEAKQWLAFWDEVRATREAALKPAPTPEVAPAPRPKG